MATRSRPKRAAVTKSLSQPIAPPTKRARKPARTNSLVVNPVDPYYLPTEAEIVDAKGIIQSEESALQNVEDALNSGQEAFKASILEAERLMVKEIEAIAERHDAQVLQMTASWEKTRAEMNAQMKDIQGRLARQRQFVAPVKGLPSEVLSEIFTVHVECGGSPWTLLRVCRLWKVVAFSTPRAWRFIRVGQNEKLFDSGTSFQDCFTNTHFEKALSRTGAAPLDISIFLPRTAVSNRIFALFNTLTKVLGRCDALELKATDRYSSAEDQKLLATLQFPVSSSLKSLRIETGWESTGIAQKIFVASNHESAALRELSLTARRDYSLVHSLANHHTLLKRLISFSTDFKIPKDLLATMRSLTCLSHTCSDLALPEVSSVADLLEEAVFDRTHFLELSTHQFGHLKKLVLHSCIIPAQRGAIKVPVLDTLVFQGISWLPILVFDCPSLSHLELEEGPFTKTVAKRELNQLWGPERGFFHLKTLKVDFVMSDVVLIAILKKLVALERLSLSIPYKYNMKRTAAPGDTFFNSLLISNSYRLGFLRNLRTLNLQSECPYSAEPDSFCAGLRTGIKRVVRSRQQAAPLWSATLQAIGRERYGCEMVIKEEFAVCKEEQ